MLVVVHGATGAQGGPVVDRLLAAGHAVRAVTRGRRPTARTAPGTTALPGEPSVQVEAVTADLTDVEDLVKAYDGTDAAVLVLPGGAAPDEAVAQADTILTALARVGVPRAVFNTSGALWTRPPGIPFLDARTRLAAALPQAVERVTLVGPATFYMENYSEPWLVQHLHHTGDLLQSAPPDVPLTPVAIADLADAALDALDDDTPPARVVVHGPTTLTGADVADALTAHLNRPVRWVQVDPATHLAGVAAGLGRQYADNIAALYGPDAEVPPPDDPPPDARHITGRLTLEQWIPTQNWQTKQDRV